jgi:hypothetical protein
LLACYAFDLGGGLPLWKIAAGCDTGYTAALRDHAKKMAGKPAILQLHTDSRSNVI